MKTSTKVILGVVGAIVALIFLFMLMIFFVSLDNARKKSEQSKSIQPQQSVQMNNHTIPKNN